jgi:hypothetical protein
MSLARRSSWSGGCLFPWDEGLSASSQFSQLAKGVSRKLGCFLRGCVADSIYYLGGRTTLG